MSDIHREGWELVMKIIIKRRRKCQLNRTHLSVVDSWGNVHSCQACGVVG